VPQTGADAPSLKANSVPVPERLPVTAIASDAALLAPT